MLFLPGRQLQAFSQMARLFIDSESRTDGGYLEEDSARLTEIDRGEIAAIPHFGHLKPSSNDFLAKLELLIRIGDGECHVMHGAETIRGRGSIRCGDDINGFSGSCTVYSHPNSSRILIYLLEPQQILHQLDGLRGIADQQRHAVEPANGTFGLDATLGPRHPLIPIRGDQFDLETRGIAKGECLFVEAVSFTFFHHTLLPQSSLPKRQGIAWHRERGGDDLPRTVDTDRNVPSFIGEGGPEGTGPARLVSIIEVIDVVIVEVDRTLDQSQAQGAAGEVNIRLCLGDRGGDVMETENGGTHAGSVGRDSGEGKDFAEWEGGGDSSPSSAFPISVFYG